MWSKRRKRGWLVDDDGIGRNEKTVPDDPKQEMGR
jgi:hypothetical protein